MSSLTGLHPQSRTNSQSWALWEIHHICHSVGYMTESDHEFDHESLCQMFQSVMLLFFRYDVELFQRIESLIGKKLPAFPTQEEEVMMLVERVSEAQRFARLVSDFYS